MAKENKSFWDDIVYKNGKLDEEQVMKELLDFKFVMENASKVYCAVTNERLSKIMYPAQTIISIFEDDFLDKRICADDIQDMIKRVVSKEDLIAELKDYFHLKDKE